MIGYNLNKIFYSGIRDIELEDLVYSDSLGYKIKLLGITEIENNKVGNYVYPCLVPKKSFIGNVNGVYNGIVVESNFCKKLFFQGEGAGSFPTATSVLSDLIGIAKFRNTMDNLSRCHSQKTFIDLNDRTSSYYLRFSTTDKPGVISGIANVFKKHKISMSSMLQKESKAGAKIATIVVTTHSCIEKNMMTALKTINKLNFVLKKTIYFRIENFK